MWYVDADIGEGTVIHPSVVMGKNVRIGPNCSIGQPGFGYKQLDDGSWELKPHHYRVVIGDNVEIGANTCIDRGSWRDTVIGDGCKIDNLVHIAHNVILEKDVIVVAHAKLAGSVYVGREAYIGLGSTVNQRLTIAEESFIGSGAVVTRNTNPKWVYIGAPARPLRLRKDSDL